LVGTLVRIVIVMLLVVPFVAAILFWLSVRGDRSPPTPRSDIEATWREVDSNRSDRGM
jgi:hypothetical protein